MSYIVLPCVKENEYNNNMFKIIHKIVKNDKDLETNIKENKSMGHKLQIIRVKGEIDVNNDDYDIKEIDIKIGNIYKDIYDSELNLLTSDNDEKFKINIRGFSNYYNLNNKHLPKRFNHEFIDIDGIEKQVSGFMLSDYKTILKDYRDKTTKRKTKFDKNRVEYIKETYRQLYDEIFNNIDLNEEEFKKNIRGYNDYHKLYNKHLSDNHIHKFIDIDGIEKIVKGGMLSRYKQVLKDCRDGTNKLGFTFNEYRINYIKDNYVELYNEIFNNINLKDEEFKKNIRGYNNYHKLYNKQLPNSHIHKFIDIDNIEKIVKGKILHSYKVALRHYKNNIVKAEIYTINEYRINYIKENYIELYNEIFGNLDLKEEDFKKNIRGFSNYYILNNKHLPNKHIHKFIDIDNIEKEVTSSLLAHYKTALKDYRDGTNKSKYKITENKVNYVKEIYPQLYNEIFNNINLNEEEIKKNIRGLSNYYRINNKHLTFRCKHNFIDIDNIEKKVNGYVLADYRRALIDYRDGSTKTHTKITESRLNYIKEHYIELYNEIFNNNK